MEKDCKDSLGSTKKKNLFFWSLCCSIVFALILGCFYYCLEYINQLNRAQINFERRLHAIEEKEANTYSLLVKMTSTLHSITEKFENTKANMDFNSPPDIVRRNTHVQQKSRLRRNVEQQGPTQRGDRSQVEIMERTIHSFRREMISLNDRLRHLLRYKDKKDLTGPPGARGPPGKPGAPGIRGFDGRDGYHGARGETGLQGPPGPAGPQGPTGKDGLNGMNGVPGIPGFKGQKGEKGFKGSLGQAGNNGNPGPRGNPGQPGRQGEVGEKGEPGVCPSCYYPTQHYMEMLQEMQSEKPTKAASGVTYVRWGSSNCPSSSSIVYSGHIGMSKYEHEHDIFTGSNAVCMPTKPRRRRYKRQAYGEAYSYFLRQNLPLLYKNLSILYPTTTPSPGPNVTEIIEQAPTENIDSETTVIGNANPETIPTDTTDSQSTTNDNADTQTSTTDNTDAQVITAGDTNTETTTAENTDSKSTTNANTNTQPTRKQTSKTKTQQSTSTISGAETTTSKIGAPSTKTQEEPSKTTTEATQKSTRTTENSTLTRSRKPTTTSRKPTTTSRKATTKSQKATTTSRKPTTTSRKPTTTTQKRTTKTSQKTETTTTEKPSYLPNYAQMVGTRKYISCAVCDIQEHSQQIMIPAGSTCPQEWTMQYQGYLMNYHHGTQTANIICVNDQGLGISPSSDAGIRRIVAKYLSHIVTDCATFPCPTLNRNELLKCVVCSK